MNKPITQRVDFKTTFDLEVEGKTLFDVEFSIVPDGNYRYEVPNFWARPRVGRTVSENQHDDGYRLRGGSDPVGLHELGHLPRATVRAMVERSASLA